MNISLMWADRCLKNTTQISDKVEFTRFLVDTLKIGVNTEHGNSVEELLREFPTPTLSGTCSTTTTTIIIIIIITAAAITALLLNVRYSKLTQAGKLEMYQ
jgi:hypothetical protein